ncbi:MAG: NnrS family protein, partial [Proteobacteria bacterium]
LAAVVLAARLGRWRVHRALGDPLVWSLHLGYAWLPIGFALLALGAFDAVPPIAGLHALGAGAIGTMVMAVASRVALGHTGRALAAPPSAVAAYALVTTGAALRVASALVGAPPIALGGAVWAAAFAVFAAGYAAILVRPRVDGATG